MAAKTDQPENLDSVITFIVIKKLVTPIASTDAYKFGLVTELGKLIREGETEEEKNSLTTLDKFIFKLKRLLGSKLSQLSSFMYLHTISNGITRKLFVHGNVENRSEIKRVKQSMDALGEHLNLSVETMIDLYSHNILEEDRYKDGI